MSIEQKIKEKDLLSMWRTLKSQREMFLQSRDSLSNLITDIEQTDFSIIADQSEKDLLANLKTKLEAIQ